VGESPRANSANIKTSLVDSMCWYDNVLQAEQDHTMQEDDEPPCATTPNVKNGASPAQAGVHAAATKPTTPPGTADDATRDADDKKRIGVKAGE